LKEGSSKCLKKTNHVIITNKEQNYKKTTKMMFPILIVIVATAPVDLGLIVEDFVLLP
jgi:hypothetical protein